MKRVLSSLFALVTVVAFAVATTGSATALSYGHIDQVIHCDQSRGQASSGVSPAAERFTSHHASQHQTHNHCLHPCCASTAIALLAGVGRPHVGVAYE